jgi:hypothetical protein
MAKKKKDTGIYEPVTKCDQSKELVANYDQLDDVVEITSEEEIDIAKLIVVVRGQQVLIDRDIAMLYKVETKVLNQKVKRNVARFPERFRFQLTKQEMKELVTNCDRFESLKHSSSAPYAFTEQGISMLSAVVTSQSAQRNRPYCALDLLLRNESSVYEELLSTIPSLSDNYSTSCGANYSTGS